MDRYLKGENNMSIKKSIFKIFNGSSWDEYYHNTSADQVVYTKPDGTASNVQAELAAQNSAMKRESFSISSAASEVSTNVKFSSKFNRVPTVVVTPTFQGWRLSKPIQVSNITTDGFTATAWIENGAISSDMWITVEYMAIALGA